MVGIKRHGHPVTPDVLAGGASGGWFLRKDGLAAEDRLASSAAAFAVFGFGGADAFCDESVPFAWSQAGEATRPADGEGNDLGLLTVRAEEVLGSFGDESLCGQRGLEATDARPLFNGVNQVRGGGVGIGVDHLVENVVGNAARNSGV
jgi:hypothetical protein